MPAPTKPHQTGPTICPSLIYSACSFPFFHPGLSHSAAWAAGLFPLHPGEKQIPEEECNKAPVSPSVSAVERRWAVFTKHTCVHIKGRQTALINLWEIQPVQILSQRAPLPLPRILPNLSQCRCFTRGSREYEDTRFHCCFQ